MPLACIVDAVRTPIGKNHGGLAHWRPDRLLSTTLNELIHRLQIDPSIVQDVIVGCVTAVGEQGANIGRLAILDSELPYTVPGVTINRMCGSSQEAINMAARTIESGDAECLIACGVESMSRIPISSDATITDFNPDMLEKFAIPHQGISAEIIADHWNLSREVLDEWAYRSHRQALNAWASGAFDREVLTIAGRDNKTWQDEGVRADTTPEKLAGLRPAFKDEGKVTAGNSSQISDGAAGVLLMSDRLARTLGRPIRAIVRQRVAVGVDPVMMLHGVIPATQQVLKAAALTIQDIGLFEVNEAFASVVAAWQKELGIPREKVNVRGGAIALGHPLGASGARIATTLLHAMEDYGVQYGLQTMCIGWGMAVATIYERPTQGSS